MVKKSVILYPAILFFVLFLGAGCSSDTDKKHPAVKDHKEISPDFTLKKLGIDEYVELSDFKGRPVFLDFWATWCPPCKASMPMVDKMYEKYSGKVHFIGINLDVDVPKAVKYIKDNEVPYTQLEGINTDVQERFSVHGIPAFFILDEDSVVLERFIGYRPDHYNTWTEILDGIIQE
ncbi:TlpA family protein disulfide reductase [Elusimicrobiota bacterium]